jgi:hypothetical protein
MRVLLCRLNGVPDDEAEEIRELLRAHHIDHYETPGGLWGISVAGIWLPDDAELARAKRLLKEYQHNRAAQAQAEYARLKAEGRAETLLDRIRRQPLQFLLAVAFAAVILYFSISPFFWLAGG